jgi:uncharacterized membrane protein YhaH (DUF805 family)
MQMIECYKDAMRNYLTFSGRASRPQYWYFVLMVFLISLGGAVIDGVLMLGFLSPLISLIHFLPSLAVGARRLHDTDRAAWWLLLMLVPLIGTIVLIVFLCLPGSAGDNRFGPQPA